jgi:hypothetical protein
MTRLGSGRPGCLLGSLSMINATARSGLSRLIRSAAVATGSPTASGHDDLDPLPTPASSALPIVPRWSAFVGCEARIGDQVVLVGAFVTERDVDTVSICECEMLPFYFLKLCECDKLTLDNERVHRVHRPTFGRAEYATVCFKGASSAPLPCANQRCKVSDCSSGHKTKFQFINR